MSSEGLVKGVLSGDLIVVSGKLDKSNPDKAPEEKTLSLSMISAPKINSQSTYEEELCGWDSRNYLRKLILGNPVQYTIDYTSGDNNYAQIFLNQENLNLALVKQGLAKVNSSKTNDKLLKSEIYKSIKQAEEDAQKSKLGMWGKSNDSLKLKIKKQEEVDCNELFEKIKHKEVDAMVEMFFNCSGFLLLLKEPYNCVVKASLRYVSIPSKDTEYYKAGKAFAERQFLHKDVKAKFFGYEEGKNFIVDIYDYRVNSLTKETEQKQLSSLVLGAGYSKLFVNNNILNDKLSLEAAKEAQEKGQNAGIRCWQGYVVKTEKPKVNTTDEKPKSLKSTFAGFVNSVQSGDSISVRNTETGELIRVFLSHTRAPAFAKANTTEEDKPWAWQAKEKLRKQVIGKNVVCEFDFSKEMKDTRYMDFYSVFLLENDTKININQEVIEKGLALCNSPKGNDKESSKYLDKYIEAEIKAKEQKLGIHSTKIPGNPNYCDLISANPKKKKEFIPRNSVLKNAECVVEYAFSANRFKVRVDKTSCFLPFRLAGLKVLEIDNNMSSQWNELSKKSCDYISDLILQREGFVSVIHSDKIGNYFGNLNIKINNVLTNVGSLLLKSGYAIIHNPQNLILPSEYKTEEEKAAKEKLGIWSIKGLDTLLKESDLNAVNFSNTPSVKYIEKEEKMKIRITDMVDFKNIYCNFIPNKDLSLIEKVLSQYDDGTKKPITLQPPFKKGVLCMCRYHADKNYYRAMITSILKDDKFEIVLTDYGTIDIANRSDLYKIDDSISTIPSQVVECELASLTFSKNSHTKSLNLYPKLINLEKILPGKTVYSYKTSEGKTKHGIVIYLDKVDDDSKTIHHDLLSKGFAKFDTKKPITDTLKNFIDIEKESKSKGIGMWVENEESDNDE